MCGIPNVESQLFESEKEFLESSASTWYSTMYCRLSQLLACCSVYLVHKLKKDSSFDTERKITNLLYS
jgi:hypothetical protein